jgi:hypothetical protein
MMEEEFKTKATSNLQPALFKAIKSYRNLAQPK